jgi:hypothetical protein
MSRTRRLSNFARVLRNVFLIAIIVTGLLGQFPRGSFAGLFTLTDGNSSVDFDTTSQANAYNWQVDGLDQLFQQAFWYRVGNVAEQSVHALPIGFELASNTNADPGLDTLDVIYNGLGFDIEIKYSLDGGALSSGVSDMGEQISITNRGSSPLNFRFFQYSDFDLQGSLGGDTAVFTNANTVRQSDGPLRLTETVVTPVPSHREIDFYANTVTKLNDAVPTTLSDTPATGVPFGPGDITWAYQWDVTIPAFGTFQISKDKNLSAIVIPEPASFTLLAALAGLLLIRRRMR